ncbi:DUF6290 family protein, partial [Streptococcus mutans]|uniref:DUF6290 family protein n=1 Tax=Streptococcus mutans TaxID=1309 RepID=UPI001F3E647F
MDKANREALYACFKADDLSEYVQAHGLTISEFARQAMLEKIEDDLQILRQAMAEDDGTRISHREVFKKFGTKVSNSFNLCNIK